MKIFSLLEFEITMIEICDMNLKEYK